jgi:hypothetical protein
VTPALRAQILALYRSGAVKQAIALTLAQYPGMTRAEAKRALKDLMRSEGAG